MAVLAALLLALAAVWGASATRGEAETLLKGSFRGGAYGTYANAKAGPVAATLGRSAVQPCPCRGTDGKTLSNTVESLSAGENGRVLKANVTRSTVLADKTASSAKATNTSTVAGLNALDGLITARAINAVANTSANATTINTNVKGSGFVDLRIAGKPIEGDVAANTRVALPGLGHVVLKRTVESGDGKSLGQIRVDMITIVVTRENDFDLPVGSRIVVAHAKSGFSRVQPNAVVSGRAYAATANAKIGNVLQNGIGKAAVIHMSCEGTGGKTRTNNIEALNVGNILFVGTGVTTAFGGKTSSGTVAKMTATVEDASLLDGLISADAIKAVARDTFKEGKRYSSTQGSHFVNLRVAGVPVAVDAPPNTKIALRGIGYVIINEQSVPSPTSRARTQVNGLHVFVTKDNALGLPVGAEIIVAHADSAVARF